MAAEPSLFLSGKKSFRNPARWRSWNEVKDHYLYVFSRYREWFAAAGDFPEVGAPLTDPDQLPRDVHVVGTPEQIIAEIEQIQTRFAFDRMIIWARPPGLSIEASSRSRELIASHVLPHFQRERVMDARPMKRAPRRALLSKQPTMGAPDGF